VKQPVDVDDVCEATAEYLIERFGLIFAPPDANPPIALVTPDFRKNAARLLMLVPSAGAPFGAWDTDLPENRGASVPIIQWALANQYAVALFSAAALEASPADAWDRIIRGSPAHHVVTLVASRGALDQIHSAMAPIHEILYARARVFCMPWDIGLPSSASPSAPTKLPEKPKELRNHLRQSQMQWPDEWALLHPHLMRQRLFEMLKEKEDAWSSREANKYSGLQQLKENDIPGLKRLGVDQRVQRLHRDRDKDELAQLINKHATPSAMNDDEEEPGVD
jgi:hypothetical protein